MLIMRQFDGVEKIKTIGSTYMAASGLDHQNQTVEVHNLNNYASLAKTKTKKKASLLCKSIDRSYIIHCSLFT